MNRGEPCATPARIDRILELVREVWEQYPDLRLGQLLVNALRPSRPCPQIYGVEDTVTEKRLAEYLSADQEPYAEHEVTLELTKAEALVLIAFLLRFRDRDQLRIEHPAESQILWDLCALLERHLGSELLDPAWPRLLDDARKALRVTSPEPRRGGRQ